MKPTAAEDYTNFGGGRRRPDPELRTILRFDRTNQQFLTRFVTVARPCGSTSEMLHGETRAKEPASWLRRSRYRLPTPVAIRCFTFLPFRSSASLSSPLSFTS